MLLENKNAIIYGAGGAIGSGVGVKSCTLTFRIFRRSHHVVNMRARSCCFSLGRIIRDYPPSPAEGLTSNERSVALTLFKALALSPHRHLVGEQCCGHCGKVNRPIATLVPFASSPVSCCRAVGQKNCENTTAFEELIVGSCADAIDFSIY